MSCATFITISKLWITTSIIKFSASFTRTFRLLYQQILQVQYLYLYSKMYLFALLLLLSGQQQSVCLCLLLPLLRAQDWQHTLPRDHQNRPFSFFFFIYWIWSCWNPDKFCRKLLHVPWKEELFTNGVSWKLLLCKNLYYRLCHFRLFNLWSLQSFCLIKALVKIHYAIWYYFFRNSQIGTQGYYEVNCAPPRACWHGLLSK